MINCIQCGKELSGRQTKYCSHACDNANRRKPRDRDRCILCDGKLKRGARFYCSKACHDNDQLKSRRSGKKTCYVCKTEKLLDEFYSNGKRPHSRCKACASADMASGSSREYLLKSKFGMTLAEYQRMWDSQGGVCLICGREETEKTSRGITKQLAVDHDHETGRVRALLCSECNKGIGQMHDSPERLRAAADYLEAHQCL